MLTEERHELILTILKRDGVIKVTDLVEWTKTSESTIRRDLSVLEGKKALKRVHGGAILLKRSYNELSYEEKLVQNSNEKSKIAKYATTLIEEGDCIYLDGRYYYI
jgi:Transcriptional regulators of sugar metabolism